MRWDLLWEYDFTSDDVETDAFKQAYYSKVLTHGRIEDLREIGIPEIAKWLARLSLPWHVRKFWEWYLNTESVRAKYGDLNIRPTPTPPGVRRSGFMPV
jgi:hypothetical protein